MKLLLKNNKGLTLIELIIVMAIMGIVVQGAYSILFFGQKSFSGESGRYKSQSDARMTVDKITNVVKNATSLDISNYPGSSWTPTAPNNYIIRDNTDGTIRFWKYDNVAHSYTELLLGDNINITTPASPFTANPGTQPYILGITIRADSGTYNSTISSNLYLANQDIGHAAITGTAGDMITFQLP